MDSETFRKGNCNASANRLASGNGGSHRRGGCLMAPQITGEIKMTVKKFELKTFMREEWLAMDKQTLEDQLEKLTNTTGS
jgi:hypothetical protein